MWQIHQSYLLLKGLKLIVLKRASEILNEILGTDAISILSGPSHAEEVAREVPTTVVVAANDFELVKKFSLCL